MSSGLESNGLYPLPYLVSNWSRPTVLHYRSTVRQRLFKLQLVLLITNLIIHSLNLLYFKSVSINFSTNAANTFLFFQTVDLNEIHTDSVHYHVLQSIYHRIHFIFRKLFRDHRCRTFNHTTDCNGQQLSFSFIYILFYELAERISLPINLITKSKFYNYYITRRQQHRYTMYYEPNIPINTTFYTTSANNDAIPIVADRVSLPSIGDQVSNIELSSVLPPNIYQRYYNVEQLLITKPINLNDYKRPSAFCANRSEYIKLLKRMVALKMVTFTDTPIAVNGLFGVPKDGDQIRLIIDATPANLLMVPPPIVQLPNPSHLSNIQSSNPFYVAKLDLSNYYHQLRLPEPLQPFFCLPAISEVEYLLIVSICGQKHGRRFPMLRTLPMGWSHSVFLAQCVHEHILYTVFIVLSPYDNILVASVLFMNLHLIYIDDLMLMGYDREQLQLLVNRIQAAYAAVGIKVNLKKSVSPTCDDVKVIGVQINGSKQRIFIDGVDIVSLIGRTQFILNVGQCTGHCMSVLIGHWCWYLLLNRPLLAILNECYRFIEVFRTNADNKYIWSSMRNELLMVCCLSPLLQLDLSSQVSQRIIATDASMNGFGVVANCTTNNTIDIEQCLHQLALHVGLNTFECKSSSYNAINTISSIIESVTIPFASDQPVILLTNTNRKRFEYEIVQLVKTVMDNVDWVVIMSGQWRYNDESTHINHLELSAVLLGLRWLCSLICIRGRGRRVVMLVDNAVTKYVVTKGRSSSIPLLKLLRRICTVSIAMDVRIKLVYIPSAMNPADAASRTGIHLL